MVVRTVRGATIDDSCRYAEAAKRHALPVGGYGELGVCNDSVALVELCLRENTQIANTSELVSE